MAIDLQETNFAVTESANNRGVCVCVCYGQMAGKQNKISPQSLVTSSTTPVHEN